MTFYILYILLCSLPLTLIFPHIVFAICLVTLLVVFLLRCDMSRYGVPNCVCIVKKVHECAFVHTPSDWKHGGAELHCAWCWSKAFIVRSAAACVFLRGRALSSWHKWWPYLMLLFSPLAVVARYGTLAIFLHVHVCYVHVCIYTDWYCFYYSIRNSPVALQKALFAYII